MHPSVRPIGLGIFLTLAGCAPNNSATTDVDATTDDDETTSGDETTTGPSTTTEIPTTDGSESDASTDNSGSDTDSESDSDTTDNSESDTTESESDTGSDSSESDTEEPVNCGNGILDEGEDCDGDLFAATACIEIDEVYKEGDLGCNNDCTYNTDSCIQCLAPDHVPCDHESANEFHALELNCHEVGNTWDSSNSTTLTASTFQSPDERAYRVAKQFGSHMINENTPAFGPRAGERFLLLSSGLFANEDDDGYVLQPPGFAKTGMTNNDNPSGSNTFPGIMNYSAGGNPNPFENCDGNNDCSNTLAVHWNDQSSANDILYMEFETVVPEGTEGFSIDFAFFTAELQYLGLPHFNDVALIWLNSANYTGNITFLYDQSTPVPMNATSLNDLGLLTYDANSEELAQTGFDTEGASTGWLTAHGPVEGGETVTISIAIFDKDDSFYTSAIALDNFKWACEGCELGVPGSCGITQ